MKIKLVAYGISKDILGAKQMEYNLIGGNSIQHLKQNLISKYPSFAELQSISFAVEEEYQSDDFQLKEGHEVVIIPPVSGG